MLYSWVRRSPKIIFLLWIPAIMLCNPPLAWKALTFLPRHVRCKDDKPVITTNDVRCTTDQVGSLCVVIGQKEWPAAPKPTNENVFRGYVLDISRHSDWCSDLLFKKEDETVVNFHLRGWPPAWKGMRAEITLEKENDYCGYRMTTARELH